MRHSREGWYGIGVLDWIHVALDKVHCVILMNTLLNVGIQEKLLVCWLTSSSSLLIPLRLVDKCVLSYVLFVCLYHRVPGHNGYAFHG